MSFTVPCGCAGELGGSGQPQGFSRECPTAREIFGRLMADPAASEPGNLTAVELGQHVTDQL